MSMFSSARNFSFQLPSGSARLSLCNSRAQPDEKLKAYLCKMTFVHLHATLCDLMRAMHPFLNAAHAEWCPSARS